MSATSKTRLNFLARKFIHMGQVKPIIEPELDEKLAAGGLNPKQLTTNRKYGLVKLPVILEMAASKHIAQFSSKQFREEARYLYNVLYKHKLPDDDATLSQKRSDIRLEFELRRKTEEPYNHNDDDQRFPEEALMERKALQDKIEGKLDKRRRDWHYYEFDEYSSALYMAVRLPPNYAAITTVMREIKSLLPNFLPQSVLDFGSGMGTVSWAINSVWPKTVNEILNVDISKHQKELNEFLQRGGKHTGDSPHGFFHRQYLPISTRDKYNMVVSAFSLLDLPNAQTRVNTIENLWNKTSDLLVLIERGTAGGFTTISEARHFILDSCGYDVTKRLEMSGELKPKLRLTEPGGFVVAPCSHEFLCPRLEMSSKKDMNTCTFPTFFEPLEIGFQRHSLLFEKFSYVVLRKGGATEGQSQVSSSDIARWPRIVEKRMTANKQITHKLCCPNGHLCEMTATKRKYGKQTYRLAKSTDWGDILPVKIDDSY